MAETGRDLEDARHIVDDLLGPLRAAARPLVDTWPGDVDGVFVVAVEVDLSGVVEPVNSWARQLDGVNHAVQHVAAPDGPSLPGE